MDLKFRLPSPCPEEVHLRYKIELIQNELFFTPSRICVGQRRIYWLIIWGSHNHISHPITKTVEKEKARDVPSSAFSYRPTSHDCTAWYTLSPSTLVCLENLGRENRSAIATSLPPESFGQTLRKRLSRHTADFPLEGDRVTGLRSAARNWTLHNDFDFLRETWQLQGLVSVAFPP